MKRGGGGVGGGGGGQREEGFNALIVQSTGHCEKLRPGKLHYITLQVISLLCHTRATVSQTKPSVDKMWSLDNRRGRSLIKQERPSRCSLLLSRLITFRFNTSS